jgi:nitrate/nitrite-specific signal transduction histidine kinase
MNAKELNRDIKRLYTSIEKADMQKTEVFKQHEKEFHRLYFADRELEYWNLQSFKIMLRLNLRYRFIALHAFGLHIEL